VVKVPSKHEDYPLAPKITTVHPHMKFDYRFQVIDKELLYDAFQQLLFLSNLT
jgi:hypothetical protein